MVILTAFHMFKNMKERDLETGDIKTKIEILETKTSKSNVEGKKKPLGGINSR